MPRRLSKWFFPASLVLPWCLADCPIDPFLPPWCLASCPNGSFLPPWCLPGASQAVQLILSCLPGASQAVQLILSCLPGASQAVQCVLSCLPGASQVVQMVLSCLPGASLSKGIQSVLGSRPWRPPQDLPRTGPFAIEIVLKVRQNPAPFQNRDSIGNPVLQVSLAPPWCLLVCPSGSFLPLVLPWCLAGCPIDPFLPPWSLPVKGNSVCAGQPAVAPTPGFAANRAVRH